MNKELWNKCVAFHGHACPGLAIGFKVVEYLQSWMKKSHLFSDDEDIVCISENDACGVDAIQSLLSCTAGKGNLIIHKEGKMAFSFYFRNSNQKIRLILKNHLFTEEISKEERMNLILNTDAKDLFNSKEPLDSCPSYARIFTNHLCTICEETFAEPYAHLVESKVVCKTCYEKHYD